MRPKVLVLSNCAFSKTDSNGRTLGNFFIDWPKEKLAQFFIQGNNPDFEFCENYFKVTDKDAFKSLFKKLSNTQITRKVNVEVSNVSSKKLFSKNALTMLIRSFIWELGIWKKYGFNKWVNNFNPEIVLLQAGDCPFMYQLALDISEQYNTKLVIYNSEGYYFKDRDYFRDSGLKKIFYPFFIKKLRCVLEKVYNKSSAIIYNCDELREAYDKIFKTNSLTLYTITDIKIDEKIKKENLNFKVSYCGNLGLLRYKGLIEIANIFQKISKKIYVDVYGKIPNEEVEKDFKNCQGIHYHGMISYDKVKEVLNESDLILHVESFDKAYREDLKYAFSTKIADSLTCGTCFLLYAPLDYACTKYLKNNEAAHIATTSEELENILFSIIKSKAFREKYLENAKKLVEKNHRRDLNNKKFYKLLEKL